MRTIVLIIFNVVLLTSGQILWKIGLTREGGLSLDNMVRVALSPFILGGLALYVVATVIWFMVLSRAELSYAYPLQSMAYILGVMAGWLLFRETVPMIRWIGVLVIIAGVILVSFSTPQDNIKVNEGGTDIDKEHTGCVSEAPADTGYYIYKKGENR
ncbi:EamA family transporter [Phosphitispora sp. TUW77]|uniref:EamA family transporter n=1 Tax=Phosphitispora sp. TUW77 TaxID=3152361 RepID=UPI003AB5B76C